MITGISRKVADFLLRENIIENEYLEVYVYGIELCFSSIISIVILLSITILLNKVLEGLLFYIVFCITRLFCGGYHAKSYKGCKMAFLAVLLIVLFLNEVFPKVSLCQWVILWCFYALFVFFFAPIDNENKRLEKKERRKCKIISIVLSFFWLTMEGLLYGLHSRFAGIVPITLALIATLMLLEISKNNLRKGEGAIEERSKKECT